MKAFKKIHLEDRALVKLQQNIADKFNDSAKDKDKNENESSLGSTFFGREEQERSFNFSGSKTTTFNLKTIQEGLIITSIKQTYSDGTYFFSNTNNVYFRYNQTSGACQVVISSGTIKRALITIRYIKKAV